MFDTLEKLYDYTFPKKCYNACLNNLIIEAVKSSEDLINLKETFFKFLNFVLLKMEEFFSRMEEIKRLKFGRKFIIFNLVITI